MVGGTKLKVHSASLTATDPLLLTPVSAIKRGAQKGVFWGPTRIKTDYQLATSILGYPRHHIGAGELAGAKTALKRLRCVNTV